MESLRHDLRNAVRVLARERLFTVAAVATLALCIGANSALFSVVNSVLIRPLPYPESDRLVTIFNSYPGAGVTRAGNAIPDYHDRRESVPALESIALMQQPSVTIGEEGSPERVTALRVTPSFFDVLRVAPARGRAFDEGEGATGGPRAVIIGHGLWQERYGGDPGVVGTMLRVNGQPHEIIGVLPPGFRFAESDPRLVLPLQLAPAAGGADGRHSNAFAMIGRLAAGASLETARQQMAELNRRNDELYPQFRPLLAQSGFTTIVEGARADMLREVRGTLVLLQAGVLMVLLIGCVNIANLMLVRATARSREWATRAALGAGWGRLSRQIMTESILLAAVGGLLGLVLGYGALQLAATYAAEHIPRGAEIRLDATVAAATAVLALLAGVIFGALPIARLRKPALTTVFREEGRSATASRGALLTRGVLVTAQVALAFALLTGAGLTVASFLRTTSVDPGFRRDGVLTGAVALPAARYAESGVRINFFTELADRMDALAGVRAAGLTTILPFGTDQSASVVTAEHRRPAAGEPPVVPVLSSITPGYFDALGITLTSGRALLPSDDENGMPVVVIDETLAERLWPGEDPLGQRLFQGAYDVGITEEDMIMRTVVGVVRPVRMHGLVGEEPQGHVYHPLRQMPPGQAYLVVHAAVDPVSLVPALRRAITELDADLPLFNVRTMDERVAGSLANERARTLLLVGFASLALLLAAVGLYGVLAYTVAQRSTEIGIRMALGSSTGSIFGLVLRQGLLLVAAGLAVGAALSAAGMRLLGGMLHGVSLLDPAVHLSVLALLASVAAVACLLPAWRAARVDPAIALRK